MSVTNVAMNEIHGGSGLDRSAGNFVDTTASFGRHALDAHGLAV